MKRLRGMLTLFLAVIMLISAASCAAPSPEKDATAAPAEQTAQAPSQTAQANQTAATGPKPELTIWFFPMGVSGPYEKACQAVLDQYNAGNHGATVKMEVLGWAGLNERIQTAVASGSPPDIWIPGYFRVPEYVKMGEALDLTSIVDKWKADKDPILDEFQAGMLENGIFDGKVYVLPFATSPKTMFYRADILEDALGFKDLDKGVTFDQLKQICAAVKAKYGDQGIYPLGFFSVDGGTTNLMLNALFSNGASWVNADGTAGGYDDPKAIEAVKFVKDLVDSGYVPEGIASYNQADIDKLYQSGKIAMMWKSSQQDPNSQYYKVTKIMGPIIGPSADKPRLVTWSDGLMAFKATKHPEEVKEFIEWFVKNSSSILNDGQTTYLPLQKSQKDLPVYKNDWILSQITPMAETYTELNWPAPVSPVCFNQVFFEGTIGKPLEAILMGATDVQAEMHKTNEEITKLLKEVG